MFTWVVVLTTLPGASYGQDQPFRGDIEKTTEQNTDFRRVLFTGKNIQVVVMALRAGEEIGEESHPVDQCFFIVDESAQVTVDGKAANLAEGGVLCVPAGTRHNVRNIGRETLKLFTVYSPPQHPPGTVNRTKADAQRAKAAPPRKPAE